jgi:hypothetical protein
MIVKWIRGGSRLLQHDPYGCYEETNQYQMKRRINIGEANTPQRQRPLYFPEESAWRASRQKNQSMERHQGDLLMIWSRYFMPVGGDERARIIQAYSMQQSEFST